MSQSKPRKKKSGPVQRKTVSKKILDQLRLSSRIGQLEQQMGNLLGSKQAEARFLSGLMFGLNALVEVLESKDVLTMQELDRARMKVIQEYRQEKIEEQRQEQVRKRYKDDPVHYDTTTDKWFVFAPNWLDKIGPFFSDTAAREALRSLRNPLERPQEMSGSPPASPSVEREKTSTELSETFTESSGDSNSNQDSSGAV